MHSLDRMRDIRGLQALIRSGGPTHHCLKCGWEGVLEKDGCPICGMYGNIQPIQKPKVEGTGEIIEEFTIDLETFKTEPIKP